MKKDNLYIVIPAYNEEENIEKVIEDWHKIVEKIGNNSKLVIIDDGSKDKTYTIIKKLEKKYKYLEGITKPNEGHGATVLYGYNYAIKNKATYVFQTDSDGQTLPDEFWQFWEQRKEYDMIIGSRTKREDGFSRVIVTKVLKIVLFLIFGKIIQDANTPFRLIKTKTLKKYLNKIPEKFNLSNVLVSVLLVKNKEKVKFIPITFKPRQGGINSINIKKIIKIGWEGVKDFYQIKKSLKTNEK